MSGLFSFPRSERSPCGERGLGLEGISLQGNPRPAARRRAPSALPAQKGSDSVGPFFHSAVTIPFPHCTIRSHSAINFLTFPSKPLQIKTRKRTAIPPINQTTFDFAQTSRLTVVFTPNFIEFLNLSFGFVVICIACFKAGLRNNCVEKTAAHLASQLRLPP